MRIDVVKGNLPVYDDYSSKKAEIFAANSRKDFQSAPMPSLKNYNSLNIGPSFGSTLKSFEANKTVLKEGLRELGKEEVVLILHGGSFPATEDTDTGFGSPNSKGARQLIDFVSGVFTGIQLGPNGKTKLSDSSPYAGTLFSSNPLFIDLEQLTEPKWGKILTDKEFKDVVKNNKAKNTAETNYRYAFNTYDKVLRKAYQRFNAGYSPEIQALKGEFEEYKTAEENDPWLDNDALYEALSKKHDNDYWPNWEDELDRNLIAKKNTKEGKERIAQIRSDYADEIDFYKFTQFVYSKQIQETKEYANSKGVKFIADKQVGFSDRDTWAYQDLFLPGWKLGCPPDFFSKKGQGWGFPVVDPKKMFNEDGTLGEAGEIIKKSITKVFKEYNSLRIDHYLGLVDPWVYPEGKFAMAKEGAGRLYSSYRNPELAPYALINKHNMDPDKIIGCADNGLEWSENDYIDGETLTDEQVQKYALYIDNIVLSAAREAITHNGQDTQRLQNIVDTSKDEKEVAKAKLELKQVEDKVRKSLIMEDLGAMTTPASKVMRERQLNGIKVAQFMDGGDKTSPYLPTTFLNEGQENYWYMAGSHDTQPLSLWSKDIVKNAAKGDKKAQNQIDYVANYLYKNDDNFDSYKAKMEEDPKFLMQSVYALMMKSPAKNIQIFFPDMFGDERVYNTPGTLPEFNWKTRPQNDFRNQYGAALADNMAFDFVKSMKTALKSKHQDSAAQKTQQ